MQQNGVLYIVATPIGNLDDITRRAIDVLQSVDLVAAEDTRHSARLLQHYSIGTRTIALHEHNETQKADWLVAQLQSGHNVALISDAGTPLISDPGYHLVNLCRAQQISVVPIPGACAVVTALCASGLPTDAFQFLGFLPVKTVARQKAISALQECAITSIFYEAPRRIRDTLEMISTVLQPERKLVLAKELTKSFEQFAAGTSVDILRWLSEDPAREKGEFVLMIAPVEQRNTAISADAEALLKELLTLLPAKKAAAVVASHYDLKKNDLYKLSLTYKND